MASGLAGTLTRLGAVEPATAAVIERLVAVAVTLLVLVLGYRVVLRLTDRAVARLVAHASRRHAGEVEASPLVARSRTLGSLITSIARWVLAFVILVVVLRELGIDVQAILVSAGVLGLAVGFGAQTLIRDILSGFFLLFEGLVSVGDLLEVGGQLGTVEAIGLRVTRVRLADGGLRVIPNGALTDFVNRSAGWARAVVDVGVAHEVSVGRALAVLQAVGDAWASDTGAALDRPEAQGIMKFSGGDAVFRLSVKVDPALRLDAERELRRRIKEAFDHEQWTPVGAS